MRSLQVKFSGLLVVLLVLACVSLALIATQHERSALESEVEKRARALAASLAGAAKEPLLGRAVGDSVTVRVPKGTREFEILEIRIEWM